MIRVLAIGNSFSDDARTFVPDIAASVGEEIIFGNLYIGGCSLETHWHNADNDLAAYDYTLTGFEPRLASIREALEQGPWDCVTLQQASHFSGQYATYQPYLNQLARYVRRYAPQAEILVHQTWAYEIDSAHPGFDAYGRDQAQMYASLWDAYDRAARDLGGARVIPCGDAFQIARRHPLFDYPHGGLSLNRDGFHASFTHGRYLLGCVWVEMLTGLTLTDSAFVPSLPDDPAQTPTAQQLQALRAAAHEAIARRQDRGMA